ncbi:response regulator transcription factor [Geodermatophilus sp. SYSU D01036]
MGARVVVVESHPVTRWGIRHLIEEQDGLEVVGETASADQAVRFAATLLPDVVVIGLDAGEEHGMALARELRERFDDLGIVLLTATSDDAVLLDAFETGVSAYVPKTAPVVEVVAAVRHAAVAATSFTAAGLAAALRRQREAAVPSGTDLSAREREVLDLLVAGRSIPGLAAELFISPSTAKTYVSRVYEKLGVRSRAEAVMTAVRLGLTQHPPGSARPVVPAPRRSPEVPQRV